MQAGLASRQQTENYYFYLDRTLVDFLQRGV
jgi:hypothetical protein